MKLYHGSNMSIGDIDLNRSNFLHATGHLKTCEDMNISPQEFHMLKQSLTTELLTILTEEYDMTLPEACDLLYNSHTFEKLADSNSGLYIQSPRYILSYLTEECESDTKATASERCALA